jgi:hypothetical protein
MGELSPFPCRLQVFTCFTSCVLPRHGIGGYTTWKKNAANPVSVHIIWMSLLILPRIMTTETKKTDFWIIDFNKFGAQVSFSDEQVHAAADLQAIEFSNSWPSDVDCISESNWNFDDDGWNVNNDQAGAGWYSFVNNDRPPLQTITAICAYEDISAETVYHHNRSSCRRDVKGDNEKNFNTACSIPSMPSVQSVSSAKGVGTPQKTKASPGTKLRASLPRLLCKSLKVKMAKHDFNNAFYDEVLEANSLPRLGATVRQAFPNTPEANPYHPNTYSRPPSIKMTTPGGMNSANKLGTQIVTMSKKLDELCTTVSSTDDSFNYNSADNASTVTNCTPVKSAALEALKIDNTLNQSFDGHNPKKVLDARRAMSRSNNGKQKHKSATLKGSEKEKALSILHEADETVYIGTVKPKRLDFSDEHALAKQVIVTSKPESPEEVGPRRMLFVEMESDIDSREESPGQVMMIVPPQSSVSGRDPPEQLPCLDSCEPTTPESTKSEDIFDMIRSQSVSKKLSTSTQSQDIFVNVSKQSEIKKSTTVAQRHKWLQEQAFRSFDREDRDEQAASSIKMVIDSKVQSVAGKFGGVVSRKSDATQRKQQWQKKWVASNTQDGIVEKPLSKTRWEVSIGGTYKKKIVLENHQTASE